MLLPCEARESPSPLILALFLHAATPARAEGSSSAGKVHPIGYFVGGLLGIAPGFGAGHLIQGRYFNRGLAITVGESLGAYLFFDNFCIFCDKNDPRQAKAGLGLLLFGVFKVWEIFDVWITPSVGTASAETDTRLHWALAPRASGTGFVMPTDTGLSLAVSKRF